MIAWAAHNNISLLHFQSVNGFTPWSAFQALVYAPEVNEQRSNCLMNGKTFHLKDNSKTIPLFGMQNDYDQEETCTWMFTVPDNMELKLVAMKRDLQVAEFLRVYDGTGNSVYFTGSKGTFKGPNIRVEYKKQPFGNNTLYGIALFASATELVNIKPENCPTYPSDNLNLSLTTISNFNNVTGYAVNSNCYATIPEKKDYVSTLLITRPFYERHGDLVTVKTSTRVYGLETQDEFMFENAGNLTIDFTSDGSVVGAGFEIDQNYICKSSVILQIIYKSCLYFSLQMPFFNCAVTLFWCKKFHSNGNNYFFFLLQ